MYSSLHNILYRALPSSFDAEEFTELIFQEAPLVRDRDAEDWFDPAALLTRLKDLRAEVAAAELAELVSWSGV